MKLVGLTLESEGERSGLVSGAKSKNRANTEAGETHYSQEEAAKSGSLTWDFTHYLNARD